MENLSTRDKNTIEVTGRNCHGFIEAEHKRFTLVCTQGMLSIASEDPEVIIRTEARLLRELHLAALDEGLLCKATLRDGPGELLEGLVTATVQPLSVYEARVRASRKNIEEQLGAQDANNAAQS